MSAGVFDERALVELVRAVVRDVVPAIVREEIQATMERQWLTVPEAATRLGCSADAIRMRAKRGRLQTRKQGRRVYVSAESVERLR